MNRIQNRKALLVIDVQENLVNPKSKIHIDPIGIDLFFDNVNKAVSGFNNNEDDVIYVVNEWTNPIQNWMTGNVCKKGGKGIGLDKRLMIINDKIYSKSKPNSLTNINLLKYLKENEISDIYVAGLLAEGCVKATVKGLKSEKINVFVIEDALGSKSQKNKNAVLDYFDKHDIRRVKIIEI
jgi:nicotinamidase-related amidase